MGTTTKSLGPSKRNKKLTVKQKIIQQGAQQRQKVQEGVFAWQERLFTQEKVSAATLRQATLWLQPQTYDEIVEERCVQSICGYPLCSRPTQEQSSKYRISLSQRKVFDQSELGSYCSVACLQKSKYYAMQLSEDPVWVRDLTSPISSTLHVIPLEENFKFSVAQQQRRQQRGRSTYDIKQDYVQQLLSSVPLGTHNVLESTTDALTNNLEMTIVEKTSAAAPMLDIPFGGIHDSIEGYRIENSKDSPGKPTTILLKATKMTKDSPSPLTSDTPSSATNAMSTDHPTTTDAANNDFDIDPDSLLDDAMATMMMLKEMNLDRDPPKDDGDIKSAPSISQPSKTLITTAASNEMDRLATASSPTIPTKSEPIIATTTTASSSNDTKSLTAATEAASPPPQQPASLDKSIKATKAAMEAIEATAAMAKAKQDKKAKKKKEPEMSLFGKIWTMLDRMTTKSTRLFLTSLTEEDFGKTGTHAARLLEEDGLTDDSLLRGQIFSEKILESYGLIRSQLGIKGDLESDMVNLIRTFRFADATMVVLDASQTYMMTLVLFKTLVADVLNETGWEDGFEVCCGHIGQSSDMVDACVRVLKVAST